MDRIMASRSGHKQIAINMATSVAVFAMNLCITFFLSPYIVGKLGMDAYGFIGLSSEIIGYTSLLTIAVNSMAGRFITIKYHEGDLRGASVYMSTIFFTNLALSVVIAAVFAVLTVFLPEIVNIPRSLDGDVQTLFMMLCISTLLGLMTGVIGVSCFIRNRLDLGNIRSMIGTALRVSLLLGLFGFFQPRLWYYGISALAMSAYGITTNWVLFRRLTPELKIGRSLFDFSRLREVVASGAWNIVTRLSGMLSRGFDLLFANLFVGALAMGQLSISQTIPFLILTFFGTLAGNFGPEFTRLYAVGDIRGLRKELIRSVRLSGFLSCVPLVCVLIFSETFYELWLPGQDTQLLYYLTLAGMGAMIFSVPLEPLWNIFTITNRVRHSSMNLLYNSILSFGTILLVSLFVDDDMVKLFVLASSRALYGIWRNTTFLPIFGAKCLGLPRRTFYGIIFRVVLNVLLICPAAYLLKEYVFVNPSWGVFILEVVLTGIIGLGISWFTVLEREDRKFVLEKARERLGI